MRTEKDKIKHIYAILEAHDKELSELNNIINAKNFQHYYGQSKEKNFNVGG